MNDALVDEMVHDSLATAESGLPAITALVAERAHLVGLVARLDAALKHEKAELRALEEERLPAAFDQAGIKKLTLDDGSVVEIRSFTDAKIPEGQEDAAHTWLDEHGLGDVIKNQITASLGRSENELATEAVAALNELGVPARLKQSVPWNTLNAVAKEQEARWLENGECGVWPDSIRVFNGRRARVKEAKKED